MSAIISISIISSVVEAQTDINTNDYRLKSILKRMLVNDLDIHPRETKTRDGWISVDDAKKSMRTGKSDENSQIVRFYLKLIYAQCLL